MLSDRKAAVLRAIVEGYISTSQPVGSTQVVRATQLPVSSATVRAEMAALEEAGLVHQPHTSAGRIPTEQGYRYFVDSLMQPYQLARSEAMQVHSFFDTVHGEIERLLRDTSAFVSQLTDYAAVVVGPDTDDTLRSVQIVRLGDETALLVAVAASGAVEKWTMSIPASTEDGDLEAASTVLDSLLVGQRAGLDLTAVDGSIRPLVAHATDLISGEAKSEAPVFVGGASSIAGLFEAVDKVHDVLAVLEKQYLVVTLIRDILHRGLDVAIGSETGVEPLSDCAVVVAPYEVEGRQAGSIAVLGPTRMNYAQTLAAVAVVSRQLGHRLSEG